MPPPRQRKSPGLQIHGPHPRNPLGQQVTGLQKVPEIIPLAPSHGEQEGSRGGLSCVSRGDRRAIVSWAVSSPNVTKGERTQHPPPQRFWGGGGGEPSANQGPWGLAPPSLRRARKAMPGEGVRFPWLAGKGPGGQSEHRRRPAWWPANIAEAGLGARRPRVHALLTLCYYRGPRQCLAPDGRHGSSHLHGVRGRLGCTSRSFDRGHKTQDGG